MVGCPGDHYDVDQVVEQFEEADLTRLDDLTVGATRLSEVPAGPRD